MPYDIAIAGCGVAGLTAALLLAGAGHAVTLFEQSPQVGPAGAGVLLQPSGQLVLQRLGLLNRVTARSEKIHRLHALTHRGKTLIDLPYAAVEAGMHAYGLHRGDLFSVLHAAADAAGVKIVLRCRIVRFGDRGSGVDIFDDHGVSRGCFDFLLGADGSRSELRRASNLTARIHEYPHGALWALGTCPAVQEKLYQVTRGSRLLCGLLPMGENRCSLFWSLEKRAQKELFAGSFSRWGTEKGTSIIDHCRPRR